MKRWVEYFIILLIALILVALTAYLLSGLAQLG